MKIRWLIVALWSCLLYAGLSIAEETPRQATCPVMVGNPIDPSLFIDHEGQRIYFCCKMCVSMFSENPQEYIENLPEVQVSKDSHDHATDHDAETTSSSRLIKFVGKFHPVAVHIPIGLILMAALAELLFLCFGSRTLFRSAARFNILLAVLGAVAAIILGFAAASGSAYPETYQRVLMIHRSLGIFTFILAFLAAAALELGIRKGKSQLIWIYRGFLMLSAGSVAATGHLGGLLVYGLEHFTW